MMSAQPIESRRRSTALGHPAIGAETPERVGCAATFPAPTVGTRNLALLALPRERCRSGVRRVVALPSKYRSRLAVSCCEPADS
jgi:hypothetical protein